MRVFTAFAAAFLVVSPVFGIQRHRPAMPPHIDPCADATIARPVDVGWFYLSGDTIFFADFKDGLMQVYKGGGTPRSIAPNTGVSIGSIVADATTVYYITADNSTTGSIYSVPRGGGMPKLLATNLPAPVDMRLDSTSIYWLNLGTIMGQDVAADGSIERMLKDGSGRQKLVGSLSAPSLLDIDDANVYYGETGAGLGSTAMGLRGISKSGGTVTRLVDNIPVFALAVSGSDVFYSSASSLADAAISRVPKSGGTPQVLAPGVLGLTVAVKDARVYVVAIDQSFNTSILSVMTTGTGFRSITTADLDSGAIAIDDCALYYAANASLLRTPR